MNFGAFENSRSRYTHWHIATITIKVKNVIKILSQAIGRFFPLIDRFLLSHKRVSRPNIGAGFVLEASFLLAGGACAMEYRIQVQHCSINLDKPSPAKIIIGIPISLLPIKKIVSSGLIA